MALTLVQNPQFLTGAYNKALLLNGAFKFQPLVSAGSADTFVIGLGTVSGGSDTAGYDITAPSAFSAGTLTEFVSATNTGYASYPLGAQTVAGSASSLTLNRTSTSSYGLYSTWATSEVAFSATFTNTGTGNWDLSTAYVFIRNNPTAPTSPRVLVYAPFGQAGDVLTPQSSLVFQFSVETPTSAIILVS